MRLFKALIISLSIYLLLIWLFMRYFNEAIKMPIPPPSSSVIKITLREQPKVHSKPKQSVSPQKVEKIVKKSVPKKRIIKKKKKVQKKRIQKKKRVIKKKKKITKKKIIKKKKVIKKKKRILNKKNIIEEKRPIEREIYTPLEEEIVVESPKNEALETFESEMVYIAEPMIRPQQREATVNSVAPSFSYPNGKIKKLYGAEFQNFTSTQKEFIKNNLDTIQEITQRTLTRRGYPEGAGRTGQEGTNVVSFNLHPNGDISDLRLKTRIGYRALDENTLSLIRVAYMDYPYPSTTTKIVFYVTYSIYGY